MRAAKCEYTIMIKRRRRHRESTARQLPLRGDVFSSPVSPASRHANQIFGRAASAKLMTNALVVILWMRGLGNSANGQDSSMVFFAYQDALGRRAVARLSHRLGLVDRARQRALARLAGLTEQIPRVGDMNHPSLPSAVPMIGGLSRPGH
jgi:hypothetical protein